MSIVEPTRVDLRPGIDDEPHQPARGSAETPVQEMDAYILDLQCRLLEIEERLIPTGLHILDEAPGIEELTDTLAMVVAFERPELELPALHDLLLRASGLRDQINSYARLIERSSGDREAFALLESINATVKQLIHTWLSAGADSAASELAARKLQALAGITQNEAASYFTFLSGLVARLRASDETGALLAALRGEFIRPTPGGDIVRNPDVVPVGRNIHALNPAIVPSTLAMNQAGRTADALLKRLYAENNGAYPETIAIVLWGTDNIKTEGEATAQVWYLMGISPVRDSLNRIHDVQLIPLARLGRPRIDCVITVSGIYRDLFANHMSLLAKSVRLCAAADEPAALNFIRKHALEDSERLCITPEETAVRVFSNAAGTYGANVNFAIDTGAWENEEELTRIFVNRKCFAYGSTGDGVEAREAYQRSLGRVQATFQNIDSIEFGITDIDHYNEYTGALSRTVEQISGQRPQTMLADFTGPAGKIRSIDEMVALESRAKLLNPRWYEGMLKHGYEGVRTIQNQVTNTFGWSVTCKAVDGWIYDRTAETYILDDEMRQRLQQLNPHAAHAIADRLLEATGRGYWQPTPEMLDRLRDLSRSMEDALEGIH